MNGVWVENVRLFVKEACFGLNEEHLKVKKPSFCSVSQRGMVPKQGISLGQRPGKQEMVEKEKGFSRGRSYVQVLRGESSKTGTDFKTTLSIKPSGNGWLYRSAVAVLHRVVSMSTLNVSFSMETNRVAQFRSMGGRSVLITFQSQEVCDSLIGEQWMKLWFDKVTPWTGEPASLERLVWLSCKGEPLNVWNAHTFKLIAEVWGFFVKVDEQTLTDLSFDEGRVLIATEEYSPIDKWVQIEVAGVFYAVKISEISSFTNPDAVEAWVKTPVEPAMASENRREKEEDDDMERDPGGKSNRKKVVGVGWDSLAGKDGAGGSTHENAALHLMLVNTSSLDESEKFESRVEDSVELGRGGSRNILDHSAQSVPLDQEEFIAQEATLAFKRGDGPAGPSSVYTLMLGSEVTLRVTGKN
ncbi:hypothetical protein RHMOL_Rhmol08G0234100 [Rhododendron molle]|uniref:Uncharacterized protein n=1 Tax=Rhododendron molle TaxID=49168 RepID=A0ACC0MRI7_RHOML|nr:hypothetical protein RHMOL_Rhmol08G0234100 [Rhododendron molle]